MGLGNFLKSLINAETMGEEIVKAQIDTYFHLAKRNPYDEPHRLLALTWLTRMKALGKQGDHDLMEQQAHTETMQYACLQPPSNARALGLFCLYKERPDIIKNYPRFEQEYRSLVEPITIAMEKGNFMTFYECYNPITAKLLKEEFGESGFPF